MIVLLLREIGQRALHQHSADCLLLDSADDRWFLLFLLEVDEVDEEAFFDLEWFFVEAELQEYLVVDHVDADVALANELLLYCLDEADVLVAHNDQLALGQLVPAAELVAAEMRERVDADGAFEFEVEG